MLIAEMNSATPTRTLVVYSEKVVPDTLFL